MGPTNPSILVRRLSPLLPPPFVPLPSQPKPQPTPPPPPRSDPFQLIPHLSGPIRPGHNEDNPNLAAKQLLLHLSRLSAPSLSPSVSNSAQSNLSAAKSLPVTLYKQ
ncbi:hypothetical protein TB1_042333 [Malus domestica]